MNIERLLILGCGYVGEKLARACLVRGVGVTGTTRSRERALALKSIGIDAVVVESPAALSDELLRQCDGLLDSIPLTRDASGLSASQAEWLPQISSKLSNLKWAGYLSTTGVYGDAGGGWVDESYPCHPGSERGELRLAAERAWLQSGLPAEVFRLAGIYGPERNIVDRLLTGTYLAVSWNPPHWSNRVHVDDIVAAIVASMERPRPGRIVNVADDEPCPHDRYVLELARLVGAPAPEILSPAEGEQRLSRAALDFFMDNKRVSNRLLHRELLPELAYSGFRDAFNDYAKK